MKLVLFFHVKLETSFLYLILFMTEKKKNLPSQDVFISSSERAWLMFGSSRDVFSFLICLFVLF